MKKLMECKEYFKDLLNNCLQEDALGKSIFDSPEKAMFDAHCNTLKFIYGQEFEAVRPTWTQEGLNEFYEEVAKSAPMKGTLKLCAAKGKTVPSEEALKDVAPIDWGEDALSGKVKVTARKPKEKEGN